MGEATVSTAASSTLPTLPTHQAGYAPPTDIDAASEGAKLVSSLAQATSSSDADAFAALFRPDGFWRDSLIFTRDFRTITGTERIAQAAKVGILLVFLAITNGRPRSRRQRRLSSH